MQIIKAIEPNLRKYFDRKMDEAKHIKPISEEEFIEKDCIILVKSDPSEEEVKAIKNISQNEIRVGKMYGKSTYFGKCPLYLVVLVDIDKPLTIGDTFKVKTSDLELNMTLVEICIGSPDMDYLNAVHDEGIVWTKIL